MAKLTTQAIDVARREAVAAIRRNNVADQSAYLCRWGRSPRVNFFFSRTDDTAEEYRSRVQRAEGTKLTIVGKVTPDEAREAQACS